jgi:uncharacterized protein DUF6894
MARYFFQAEYRGVMLTDDIGEEFPTLHEAETHATVVANELGHNNAQDRPVIVFVLGDDGKSLTRTAAINE